MFKAFFTRRMLIMLMMSMASGLPLALSGTTLQAWYTVSGVNIVAIGFLSLVGQPYAFKFLWAPVMDRFIPPFLGRRRGWILITQVAVIIAIALMAFFDPKYHPVTLAVLALFLAFTSASQDISLDAYRTDRLTAAERGPGAALWANGYRIGLIISTAIALMIASQFGWRVAYLAMAGFMLFGVLTTFCATEPEAPEQPEKSFFRLVKASLQDLFQRPAILWLLLFIIIYKLGDAFALSLSSVFYLRHLGFSLDQVAWVGKTFGTIAGIVGILVGGSLMARMSLYRALMVFGILQAVATLTFCWLAIVGKVMWIFATAVFIEHTTSGMGTIALFVLLMALCNKRFTATQFAILSAISALGRIYVGPVAGYTIESIGWVEFFLISFVIGVLGLFLLYFLQRKTNLNQLERR